jgi:xanthine dehydrogenase accessory factor
VIILLLGGGDLASGVALRLHRAGLRLMITELPEPLVVRRKVAFAEAVYAGQASVEDVLARKAVDLNEAFSVLDQGLIPVLVDPQTQVLADLRLSLSPPASPRRRQPFVLVDGRMTKEKPGYGMTAADMIVGLGPGFIAGQNCHAVVETNRGHRLGRVIWNGPPEDDTGVPDRIAGRNAERVLRAPADGILQTHAEIGDHLEAGQLVAEVAGIAVRATFRGVLRGLLHPGLHIRQGLKIGDIDPRDDPLFCRLVSDKSLAVGGGVLEAILSRPEFRPFLWA